MFCVFTTSASHDKLSITLTGSHLLSPSYLPNYIKTCSFIHAKITENIKIVVKFVKKTVYSARLPFIGGKNLLMYNHTTLYETIPMSTNNIFLLKN